jgi:xanthine dehydrogenase YagR molybdenum-binding subunit
MFGFGDDKNSLTMNEPHPVSLLDTGVQGVISRPLDRVDGPAKVSGVATYAAEYAIPNLAHGVLVGAKIGCGKVVSIDVEAAKRIPGVIDVVIDFDTFIRNSQQGGETKAPTQGVKDIAYFGQIVAIVLAETFEAAREAALSIPIEYEYKAGTYNFEAHRDDAVTPPPSQLQPHFSQGDPDKAYDKAPVKLDVTYVTPSQNSAAMEPHASIAVWEDDALTLYGAYQMPTSDASQLAKSLGVAKDKVRIISRFIGGGFGSKLGIAPESVAAAIAAKQLGRPVKAVMARQQVFDATVRRSNTEQRLRFGAGTDGRITSFVHDSLTSNLPDEDYFEPVGIGSHSLYGGEHRRINHDQVTLNLTLSGSMRAPGEAVGMVGLECAMDELAERLGMDPIELRKINDPAVDPEKDVPYSSRLLTRSLEEGAKHFGWEGRNARPGTRREGEWLVGMGVAAATRNNQLMQSAAKVEIHPDGSATVSSAMTDIGTGSYTIMAQIASEILGIPVERIVMKLGDTNDPPAAGSGGSWGAASAGSAVYLACEALRGKLAKAMDVPADELTLKDGQAIGANRQQAIGDLVGQGIEATGEIKPGKQEKQFTQASYGAHFAEVAVNAVTGEVRVRRMLGIFAAGRVLNAKTARSQCLGGMTFGIGTALHEDLIHDQRNGKLVNRDLAEYHVPANADVPQLEVHFLDERDIHANPIHAKGIGELGISGAAPAVVNAIYNATGVRVRDLPITCDKLLAGLPPL